MKLYQAFLWTMIGSLTLAAALGVWALLIPRTGWVQEHVLLSALFTGLLSLPAFGCAIVLHRRRDRPIMWLGIIASAATLALTLILIWTERTAFDFPDEFIQLTVCFGIVAVWAAHFGLLRLTKLSQTWAKFVRLATIVLGTTLAVILLISVWSEPNFEWFWRVIGVLLILTLCGTIVTPILGLIELIAARGTRESLPSSLKIALTCPRCGSSEMVTAGVGRCAACGLRITIDIEEPRCTCGYLLHKLKGENCPECGRAIPEAERWHVTKTDSTDAAAPAAAGADRLSNGG